MGGEGPVRDTGNIVINKTLTIGNSIAGRGPQDPGKVTQHQRTKVVVHDLTPQIYQLARLLHALNKILLSCTEPHIGQHGRAYEMCGKPCSLPSLSDLLPAPPTFTSGSLCPWASSSCRRFLVFSALVSFARSPRCACDLHTDWQKAEPELMFRRCSHRNLPARTFKNSQECVKVPMRCSYWACTREPACKKRRLCSETPAHPN